VLTNRRVVTCVVTLAAECLLFRVCGLVVTANGSIPYGRKEVATCCFDGNPTFLCSPPLLPLRDALLEDHDQKQEAAASCHHGVMVPEIQKVVHHSQQKDTGKR